jgi:hypothetical protein
MNNYTRAAICISIVTASFNLAAYANDKLRDENNGSNHSSRNHNSSLKVALWGDEFYKDDPEIKTQMIDQTIASLNAHKLDFTVFVADTKNGSTLCTDEAIGQEPMDIFNRLDAPTLYAPGDNEWTDCHRTSNGSYDPLERLGYLRSVFFSTNRTQGKDSIKVEHHDLLGQAYSGNSRFAKKNVEFVALHIPGSNNNLVATDKQCFNKSDRTQADCDAATAEYLA